jgi:anhydro-N-acetylmuramic acid kinase
MNQPLWAMGMMSGTSLDGIDVALIRSDGETVLERGAWLTVPYTEALRHQLREAVYGRGDAALAAREMTLAHAEAAKALLATTPLTPDVIGFHGQSVDHRPKQGITLQIGDPSLLAEELGIDVVADFRRRDVAAGGQGAPLVPLFHAAMVEDLPRPIAVLNIGGIANVTWIGNGQWAMGNRQEEGIKPNAKCLEPRASILAFDTGAGNVLLNEWVGKHTGQPIDFNGEIAQKGTVDEAVLTLYLQDPFFAKQPPKSLDRNYFHGDPVRHLSLEDGAATLAAFTIQSIVQAQEYFPEPVKRWIVAGGGRHNPVLMQQLRARLPHVYSAEEMGWEGDALEAQAFGFLAIRSYYGLPLSLPTTTGVNRAVTGGALYRA